MSDHKPSSLPSISIPNTALPFCAPLLDMSTYRFSHRATYTPPHSPAYHYHSHYPPRSYNASRTPQEPPVNGTQVLEYLNKKGYSKTEATLRREVADRDNNGPIARKVQDKGWEKYVESYGLFTCALELFVITEIRSTARKLRRRQSRSLQA